MGELDARALLPGLGGDALQPGRERLALGRRHHRLGHLLEGARRRVGVAGLEVVAHRLLVVPGRLPRPARQQVQPRQRLGLVLGEVAAQERVEQVVVAVPAALGLDYDLSPELAADGISEWIERVSVQARSQPLPLDLGRTLHLHATDGGLGAQGEWTIRSDAGRPVWEHGHGKGDAAVRGAAADLLQGVLRRIPADDDRLQAYVRMLEADYDREHGSDEAEDR